MAAPVHAHLDFRRLLEALPAAAYTCDADGLITAYNSRAVKAWGREPRLNDPKDRYCGSFRMYTPDGIPAPHSECWMARCLKERKEYDGEEIVVERPDGSRLVVLVHAIPFFDDDGELAGAVNVVVDITDRKRTEQRLQESELALTESARHKDEFIATLAHELRNPLAPIRNGLQLLGRGRTDPALFSAVHAIMERQVNQLIRLVDDLLDVSRITRDQIELRREPVELGAIVLGAVETARPLVDAAGHALVVDIQPEPVLLNADPVRLIQVLVNLLNNAVKYTPKGGNIELTARRDGGEAVISVRDDGIGIPPHVLPTVFNLFVQADRDYKRRERGLGIGLTLARRLVEMHGGTLTATSDGEGLGSEFVVRLPVGVMAQVEPEPVARSSSIAGRRILIVDDNRDAAESLGMFLQYVGAETLIVHDGAAALEALARWTPSVGLLDVGMSGMDGYELARRMRQQPAGQGVMLIAVTGWGQADDRQRSKAAGIDYHLVKPVDCTALVELLARL